MANFKRIPVLVDAATGKQIDEFGAVVRDNDFFRLLFDETVVLCCQFYDVSWIDGEAQLSEHPIDPDLTLEAFGDNDFDPLTSFMFLSEQTEDAANKVNIANDWLDGSTASPANGQLSFRVNTNTVRFDEALQNSTGLQNFYFCISGVPSGQTEKTVLAYFRFKAENRPSSSVGIPVTSDPEYLTAQEVQALVKSAPVHEFSIDGITLWHTTQTSADRYYREQRNSGEWGTAIALAEGQQGIQGIQGIQGETGVQGVQGETGIDANELQIEYSIDGATLWHTPFAAGDCYLHTSTDGGSAWSTAVLFKGTQGDQGIQGNQGNQGEQGINILSSITAESFLYPKTGITNPFSNAANSPNITFDVDNYADTAALISTSSNEPMQLPKFKIPTGTTSLKFRFAYAPETTFSWASETVIWKMQYKKMTDNAAWSAVTSKDIGTDTVPASGSAPQLYEVTISLATLGLAVGDIVQSLVCVDNTSTWAHDVAFQLCEIEVV